MKVMLIEPRIGDIVLPSRPAPLRVLACKPRPERQMIRLERFITSEPLELEYLATVLEEEQLTLLDGMVDRRDPCRLARRLQAEVVLISAFVTNVHGVLALAERLARLPVPPLVFVGGPHAEVVPEHFFSPGIAGVFFADQLAALRTVVSRLHAGQPFTDVPGVAFPRPDGAFVRNPGPALDPATLPVPRRTFLQAHPGRYRYMYLDRCASVKTAFGCPERCVFCFCTEQQQGRYNARPLDAVVEEIAGLPTDHVFLLDDNFLISPTRVTEFCDRIAGAGLRKRFIAYGGADFVSHHPDLVARLRAVGLDMLVVGFEFLSDMELAAVHKRARLADNDRTVEVCRALGVELFALFIVNPAWRSEDFRRLASYVRRREIAFATFSTYTVFPGTALSRQLIAAGSPPPGPPWWRYDLLRLHARPAHLSPLRYYLWLFYLYLAPGFSPATARRLRQLYGTWGLLRLLWLLMWTGIEFLIKLAIWR
jgi:radical SAM superfamily enzyme YgiQ (UPF0313 family)